jgi:hypothetical protein
MFFLCCSLLYLQSYFDYLSLHSSLKLYKYLFNEVCYGNDMMKPCALQ